MVMILVHSSFQLVQVFNPKEKKMKKIVLSLVSVATLLLSSMALADDPKIGIVDIHAVLQSSPQIAAADAQLKQQFQGREQDIKKAQDQLKTDQDNLQKNSTVMKATDSDALQKKIDTETQQLTQMQVSFQQDVMTAQNKVMSQFVNQVKTIMNDVAKQDNLSLILDQSTVVYSDSQMDITKQVIAALKK